MKKITYLLLLVGMTGLAQIKGNKQIETRTFAIENVQHVKINFYAKITIDPSLEEGLTITTDNNLFDLIDKEVVENTLHLDQKEWIKPSKDAVITIGAPNLRRLTTGTHDVTRVINFDGDQLQVTAPIGTIKLQGKTKELRLGVELAKVDASELEAENALVNIWSWGKVKVNVINSLQAKVSNDGSLIYINEPRKLNKRTNSGGKIVSLADKDEIRNPEAKYISFKIRNNSGNRNHFRVVGPKPDGSKFGYGFPMMPFSTRKERWTVGTKVYKVNSLGFEKLLVTISSEDENGIVKLFD